MKLFSTGIALIVGAIYGGIMAAVMSGLVTTTSGDFLFNEPARTIEIVIGLISGVIGGACLAYQGKSDKKYGFGLFVEPYPSGSAGRYILWGRTLTKSLLANLR